VLINNNVRPLMVVISTTNGQYMHAYMTR